MLRVNGKHDVPVAFRALGPPLQGPFRLRTALRVGQASRSPRRSLHRGLCAPHRTHASRPGNPVTRCCPTMSRADDALARLDVVPSKPVVTEVVATTEPATLPHFVLLDVETDQPSLDTGNRRHTHERRLFRGSHPASCITRRSPRASFSSSAVSGGTIPSVSRVNLASIAHHRQSSGLSYVLSTGGCLDDLEGGFTNVGPQLSGLLLLLRHG